MLLDSSRNHAHVRGLACHKSAGTSYNCTIQLRSQIVLLQQVNRLLIRDGAGDVLVNRCMLLSWLTASGLIAVSIDSFRSLQPKARTQSGLH